MDVVKKEFVRRILLEEAQGYIKYQGLAMQQRLKFHTNNTFNKRYFNVSGGAQMDGELTIHHTAAERFQDIKRKRYSREKGRVFTVSKKIHNRYVYGAYFFIAQKLMFGLTDDVYNQIKKDIENG